MYYYFLLLEKSRQIKSLSIDELVCIFFLYLFLYLYFYARLNNFILDLAVIFVIALL